MDKKKQVKAKTEKVTNWATKEIKKAASKPKKPSARRGHRQTY